MYIKRVDSALIGRVHKLRYLGLTVDDRMSWKEHFSYISSKISPNICILKRILECMTKETLQTWYTTLIEPCMQGRQCQACPIYVRLKCLFVNFYGGQPHHYWRP